MKRCLVIILIIAIMLPLTAAAGEDPAGEAAVAFGRWDITEPLNEVLETIEMDYAYVYVRLLAGHIVLGDILEILAEADLSGDSVAVSLPLAYPDGIAILRDNAGWPAADLAVGDPDVYAEELLFHAESLLEAALDAGEFPQARGKLDIVFRRSENGIWTIEPDADSLYSLALEIVTQGHTMREMALHQPDFADALLLLEFQLLFEDEEYQKPYAKALDLQLKEYKRENVKLSDVPPYGAQTDRIDYSVTVSAQVPDAPDREDFTVKATASWDSIVWMIHIDEETLDRAAQAILELAEESTPVTAQDAEQIIPPVIYPVPRVWIHPQFIPVYPMRPMPRPIPSYPRGINWGISPSHRIFALDKNHVFPPSGLPW